MSDFHIQSLNLRVKGYPVETAREAAQRLITGDFQSESASGATPGSDPAIALAALMGRRIQGAIAAPSTQRETD